MNETFLLTVHINHPTSQIAFLAICDRRDFASALTTHDNQSATIYFYTIKTILAFWSGNCKLFEINFQTDNRQNYR